MAGTLACCLFTGALAAKMPLRKSKRKPPAVEAQSDPSPGPSASPETGRDEDSRKSQPASNATVLPEQIAEYSGELPRVRKLIETALALTTRELTYMNNSDDPANGGMDCSGFTSYVLRENGFRDVPRDASGQYAWLRKAGTFRAVLSRSPDTFELEDLRPGDLLFWTGTYATDHDPPVTHAMIYLGTEKGTKNRIMAGSSDGRSYHGISRYGVGVFDLYPGGSPLTSGSKSNHAVFAGYARPPGLRD